MHNPFSLADKRILITGASSGIGREAAILISRSGARCVILGRNSDRLSDTLNALEGEGHQAIVADLLLENDRKSITQKVDGIDGVVHAAGLVAPFPIKFLSDEKISETFDINYKAPVLLTKALLASKCLNDKASHVFISSISADHPHKGGSLYAGSKSALQAFSKTLALETYHLGMRSNCVSPAMVKTPMYDKAEAGMSKESMDEHVSKYPLGVGEPEDVANAIIYLLSDASKWITGINITLDGGFLLEAK